MSAEDNNNNNNKQPTSKTIVVALQLEEDGSFRYKQFDEDDKFIQALYYRLLNILLGVTSDDNVDNFQKSICKDYQDNKPTWPAHIDDIYKDITDITRVDVLVTTIRGRDKPQKETLNINKPNEQAELNVCMLTAGDKNPVTTMLPKDVINECIIYNRSLTTDDIKHYAENSKNLMLHSCELNDINFEGYSFNKPISFFSSIFRSNSNFNQAKFTKKASFWGAQFTGVPSFRETKFTDETDFRKVIFTDEANFREATFTGKANFSGANFEKAVKEKPTFYGATFEKVFQKKTNFEGAEFKSEAIFTGINCKHNIDYNGAIFDEVADFSGSTFLADINLNHVVSNKALNISSINIVGSIHIASTLLNDELIAYNINLINKDTSKATTKQYVKRAAKVIYNSNSDDKKKDLVNLRQSYSSIKNMFINKNNYIEASRWHGLEMIAQQELYKHDNSLSNLGDRIVFNLSYYVSNHRQSIIKPILWLIGAIFYIAYAKAIITKYSILDLLMCTAPLLLILLILLWFEQYLTRKYIKVSLEDRFELDNVVVITTLALCELVLIKYQVIWDILTLSFNSAVSNISYALDFINPTNLSKVIHLVDGECINKLSTLEILLMLPAKAFVAYIIWNVIQASRLKIK